MENFLQSIEECNLDSIIAQLEKTESLVNMIDSSNTTLLHAAVIYAHLEILDTLIAHVDKYIGKKIFWT